MPRNTRRSSAEDPQKSDPIKTKKTPVDVTSPPKPLASCYCVIVLKLLSSLFRYLLTQHSSRIFWLSLLSPFSHSQATWRSELVPEPLSPSSAPAHRVAAWRTWYEISEAVTVNPNLDSHTLTRSGLARDTTFIWWMLKPANLKAATKS